MESGRWYKMGPELARLKDRHERDFVIQPTSEEVIADIVREQVRSYKQLPVNLYHIQTKFRDERRPRFGLMRSREFTMKDAYSFDRDDAAGMVSYRAMYDAYERIFSRMGLKFRAVAADTGNIGGRASHEFQVIADTGEDAIAYCPTSDYAANIEMAEAVPLLEARLPAAEVLRKVPTPGKERCEDVAELLSVPLTRTVKSIVLAVDRKDPSGEALDAEIWLLLVRGDHDLNEVKAGKVPGLKDGFRFATEAEIRATFGCRPGYLGPIGAMGPVRVVADRTVANMSDFVCGANEENFHLSGGNWGRDLPEPEQVADLRSVVAGDPSPDGRGILEIQRGIEVGHVFAGLPYAESMRLVFTDEAGQLRPMVMGCYGIGVTRLMGAAIEQNHDERGIIWPEPIAPFVVVLCPVNYRQSEQVRQAAEHLYAQLQAGGVDVVLDDRGERPGSMFADWELIGVPHRITIGERGLRNGEVEYAHRRDLRLATVPLADVPGFVALQLGSTRP
jgi:prolyl-tRNA synthetase